MDTPNPVTFLWDRGSCFHLTMFFCHWIFLTGLKMAVLQPGFLNFRPKEFPKNCYKFSKNFMEFHKNGEISRKTCFEVPVSEYDRCNHWKSIGNTCLFCVPGPYVWFLVNSMNFIENAGIQWKWRNFMKTMKFHEIHWFPGFRDPSRNLCIPCSKSRSERIGTLKTSNDNGNH